MWNTGDNGRSKLSLLYPCLHRAKELVDGGVRGQDGEKRQKNGKRLSIYF